MKLARTDLPAKTESEKPIATIDLSGKLGSATISTVTMLCEPAGLTLGTPTIGTPAKSFTVSVEGGDAGQGYIISAICTLSDGRIVEPWLKQRVIEAGGF
jgi:hypothetical protein